MDKIKNKTLADLSKSTRTEFGRVPFATQSAPQKIFSSVWELESQLKNGGFDQYLRFADSDIVTHAPVALEAIGARGCQAVVRKAIGLFGPQLPTRDQREDALDSLEDEKLAELERLDEAFLAGPDDLTGLLYDFVTKHPESFGQLP